MRSAALAPPDAAEQVIVNHLLGRALLESREYVIVRRFIRHEPGDKWGGVVNVVRADLKAKRVTVRATVCYSAQKDAGGGKRQHVHNDGCDIHELTEALQATGFYNWWWQYWDEGSTVLAAWRWDPYDEGEPFGWVESYDGRLRPLGWPDQETTKAEMAAQSIENIEHANGRLLTTWASVNGESVQRAFLEERSRVDAGGSYGPRTEGKLTALVDPAEVTPDEMREIADEVDDLNSGRKIGIVMKSCKECGQQIGCLLTNPVAPRSCDEHQ